MSIALNLVTRGQSSVQGQAAEVPIAPNRFSLHERRSSPIQSRRPALPLPTAPNGGTFPVDRQAALAVLGFAGVYKRYVPTGIDPN